MRLLKCLFLEKGLDISPVLMYIKVSVRGKQTTGEIKMCDFCEALSINGVKCHETGCPDAWRDEVRECGWCSCEFTPENKRARFCSDDCYNSFIGIDIKEEIEEEEESST